MSISSAYALIPDKGSVGYSIYQAKLKAKQEAAAAAKSQTAPTPSMEEVVDQAAAQKAHVPQTLKAAPGPLIKESGLSEEDAMAIFLTNAKTKYAEAGERTKVEGVSTVGGEYYSADELREKWGNPFVGIVNNAFSSILSTLDGYGRQVDAVARYQEKIADGDVNYIPQLAMTQPVLEDSKAHLVNLLSNLKTRMEEEGNTQEAEEFFGEYTEFTRGESLSLQKLYDMFLPEASDSDAASESA